MRAFLVTYFLLTLVLPTVFGILATNQPDFVNIRPSVHAELARSFLFEGPPTAVSSGPRSLPPLVCGWSCRRSSGCGAASRSEVK